jgi:predicted DCC family thiol-disulfide oxidoreductase YuxK
MLTATFAPTSRVRAATASPSRLTVVYDDTCGLCIRCRHWLEGQPTHVPLDFVPTSAPWARERWGDDLPWLGYELIVVSDRGEAWIGPAAFLMCLWATRAYREWSYRLSSPAMAPLARWFFERVSSRRHDLARWLGSAEPCDEAGCHHRK